MRLSKLEKAGHNIALLPGKQNEADHAATRESMAQGVEFIHQASLCNEEKRGTADLLKRIDRPSLLGHRPDQFWAWYQLLRQRYRQFRKGFDPAVIPEDAPGDHGGWSTFIEQRLEEARDLILVAVLHRARC